MKTLFCSLLLLLSFSVNVFAQQKIEKNIASVKSNGEFVDFNLSSPRPFIFGNNRYILHIGNADFYRNKQTINPDRTGSMTFLIPISDFNALKDGAAIYLTYGQPTTDNNDLEELSKGALPCWSLGKFDKSLLNK
jgi:hypothetical protein